MTVATYHSTAIPTTRRPLKGLGTKHTSTEWTNSVRCIRAALCAARPHAPQQGVLAGDALAEILIDEADGLTVQDRSLLAVVLGDLINDSKKHLSQVFIKG
jgi:hypothetical protein